MMNDQHGVAGFFHALLKDYGSILESDTISATEKDISILIDRYNHRGLSILMIDLPKLGKIFDKGLSSTTLEAEKIPHSLKTGGRGFIFESLTSLVFNKLWTGPYVLQQDADPNIIHLLRTIFYGFKKVEENCPERVVKKAMYEFFELDASLRAPTMEWNYDTEIPDLSFRSSSECLDGVTPHLDRLLGILDRVRYYTVPDQEVLLDELIGRHGPGAVSDLCIGSDKYRFPGWTDLLSSVFDPNILGRHNDGDPHFGHETSWGTQVSGSAKLIAVPKTLDKPRLIASEPTANQWCQQALLRWIRRNLPKLNRHFVDFHSQEPSKEMCREAYFDGLATVDLSSASDRLSCWTVERYFNRNKSLLRALRSCRTPRVRSEAIETEQQMNKFAAQGSAVTFPIQTIVYLGCCLASVIENRYGVQALNAGSSEFAKMLDDCIGEVRVFGDDIIIPEESLSNLALIFQALQLKINISKTHYSSNGFGGFNESCGMDSWRGHDVTPLYLHHLPDGGPQNKDLASWVAVSNNAHDMGLWYTADYLVSQIRSRIRRHLPVSDGPLPCIGLSTFSSGTKYPHTKHVWNPDWHIYMVKCYVMCLREEVEVSEGWTTLLQYFTEGPRGEQETAPLLGDQRYAGLGFAIRRRVFTSTRWVAERH